MQYKPNCSGTGRTGHKFSRDNKRCAKFLGVFFSRLINKSSKMLTYQKMKRNLKFSCLTMYLINLQEAERLLNISEYFWIVRIYHAMGVVHHYLVGLQPRAFKKSPIVLCLSCTPLTWNGQKDSTDTATRKEGDGSEKLNGYDHKEGIYSLNYVFDPLTPQCIPRTRNHLSWGKQGIKPRLLKKFFNPTYETV